MVGARQGFAPIEGSTTTTPTKSFYGGSAAPAELRFATLTYPMDLNKDNFYPDCVCFTIQKRTGVSIQAVTNAASASVTKFKDSLDKKGIPPELAKVVSKEREKNKGAALKVQKESMQTVIDNWYKDPDADPQRGKPDKNLLEVIGTSLNEFTLKMGGEQTRALTAEKEGRNILGSIYLNMPNGIQFNEAANWGGDSLGFMGNMTRNVISGGDANVGETLTGAVAGSAGSLVGAAIGALPSLVSKLGLQGGMFGMAIGAMAAGGPLQKGAESALGIAQNPYMEMMFSGIGFRKFQFDFILRPKSTKEVQEVGEIIKMFRTHSKPSYVEGKLGTSFMNYPMEFKIEFLTSGAKKLPTDTKAIRNDMDSFMTNPHVPKLKACVCDNVTTNYTPQSIWAAHKQGAPVAVTLNLSFQETELVMADDVYSENY